MIQQIHEIHHDHISDSLYEMTLSDRERYDKKIGCGIFLFCVLSISLFTPCGLMVAYLRPVKCTQFEECYWPTQVQQSGKESTGVKPNFFIIEGTKCVNVVDISTDSANEQNRWQNIEKSQNALKSQKSQNSQKYQEFKAGWEQLSPSDDSIFDDGPIDCWTDGISATAHNPFIVLMCVASIPFVLFVRMIYHISFVIWKQRRVIPILWRSQSVRNRIVDRLDYRSKFQLTDITLICLRGVLILAMLAFACAYFISIGQVQEGICMQYQWCSMNHPQNETRDSVNCVSFISNDPNQMESVTLEIVYGSVRPHHMPQPCWQNRNNNNISFFNPSHLVEYGSLIAVAMIIVCSIWIEIFAIF